jgi:hypothetical protein
MIDMIERVAQAVKDCEAFPLGDMREYLSNADALTIARAAIAAMREPTEEMAQTVASAYTAGVANPQMITKIYSAVIDAALEGK